MFFEKYDLSSDELGSYDMLESSCFIDSIKCSDQRSKFATEN